MKTLARLAAAPLLGGLFVVFLPLIGFVLLGWVGINKLVVLAGHEPLHCPSLLK
jgi:hypothetical protein